MSRNWYILNTYTGYEGKIRLTINTLLEKKEIDSSVLFDVVVPEEEVTEIKDGKTKTRKVKFLPGYVLLEMDLPEVDWKKTCAVLRGITGVTGFVGTSPSVRPKPITTEEAKNLLQRCGKIKGEKVSRVVTYSFEVGDSIKITDGPFASFPGVIKEINGEKEKLSVEVQIFGRPTPVEVSFNQVEKAN